MNKIQTFRVNFKFSIFQIITSLAYTYNLLITIHVYVVYNNLYLH